MYVCRMLCIPKLYGFSMNKLDVSYAIHIIHVIRLHHTSKTFPV